ncbi:MAG: purine-binding chemotaxis protein CheW [Gammaproteobacteria bacterium]|nr:purine-binding chemotaxis protein CheW [Gammaproteobacteria bacterium]
MTQNNLSPFNTLLEIEHRSKASAVGLPQQAEVKRPWSGIGFKIGDLQMVSAVGDVKEILHFPRVTTIPGTKSWVKGMANVRGNLIPIIDLNGYLGKKLTNLNTNSRVLIINNADLWAGLLVDQVLGLKHFFDDEQTAQKPELDEALDPYLPSGYQKDNDNWYVFSMKTLAENPEFYQVSI